jgi:hypothetical protein
MCPLCIGTALLLWSGTGSAGGVAAISLRSIKRRRGASSSGRRHRVIENAQTGADEKARLIPPSRGSVARRDH